MGVRALGSAARFLLMPAIMVPLPAAAQEAEWARLSPDECGASVEMPGETTLTVHEFEKDEHVVRIYSFDVWAGYTMFSFACPDFGVLAVDGTLEQTFETLEHSARARVGVDAIESTRLYVHGHPALDYLEPFGDQFVYHHRIVAADGIKYQLSVGGLEGTDEDDVSRFFGSFELD